MNENLFYLTNDILSLKEKDKESHCPILVTIEPSEMSRQEKKTFLNDEAKKKRIRGRQIKKLGKQWARLRPLLEVYFSSEKITSFGYS